MQSGITRTMQVDGRDATVVKIYDKGWEGIVCEDINTRDYYIEDLMWISGGYVERVRLISAEQFNRFKIDSSAPL